MTDLMPQTKTRLNMVIGVAWHLGDKARGDEADDMIRKDEGDKIRKDEDDKIRKDDEARGSVGHVPMTL